MNEVGKSRDVCKISCGSVILLKGMLSGKRGTRVGRSPCSICGMKEISVLCQIASACSRPSDDFHLLCCEISILMLGLWFSVILEAREMAASAIGNKFGC